MRHRHSTALRGFAAALLMKLCQKIIENQFSIKDPAYFRLTNDTKHEEKRHVQNCSCHFDRNIQEIDFQPSVTSWVFTQRYMLPLLGGLLSSAWLGYVRVLQIGGAVMLLSTVLMSAAVYLGLMCQLSSSIIPITWLLLPLFFGLTQPSLVHGMFKWHSRQKLSTVASTIYYFTAATGEWIALLLLPLSEVWSLGNHSMLIYIAVSVVFVALSFLLPTDSDEDPFEMPTRSRMIRYCQIFSGLILFLVSVADTRSTVYTAEINHYLNGTSSFEQHSWLSPKLLNLTSMIISCLILILMAFIKPQKLPVEIRMQAGILLESSVALSLMIFTSVGKHDPTAAVAVYSVASIVDAVAEVLIMVAAYDLVQQMAPSSSKTFVYGIMFTVWGLANLTSRVSIIAMGDLMHPAADEKPRFYIYHMATLVALISCSAYHRFVALPLALQVTPTGTETSGPDDIDEIRPLLDQFDTQ